MGWGMGDRDANVAGRGFILEYVNCMAGDVC